MNLCGKIAIGLAGGLALTVGVRADDVVLPGDPYAIVVARNIFGLNPPPPPNANPQDANPPPKITPNGIMTIFGQLQVLFKVAGTPKPGGAPPADEPYILSEGQRQDDIEVVKIDEKNSIVTFNNHGETQTLPLVTTMPSSTPSPVPTVLGGGGPGARFSPGFVNPGGGPGTRPRGGGGGNGGGGANTGGPNNGANFGNVPTPYPAVVQHPSIDPATQTIMIEANRLQAQQQGDPTAKIFPITELTPPSDSGSGSQ